jgi:acyl-CoA synthetase (AMP-forming)/AMP-acid ligase II
LSAPATAPSDAQNAASLFRDAAARMPAAVAFYSEGPDITFGALWERVGRFSAGLAARGFAPGDRAIVMLPMSVDLYVALLAVLGSGGIAVFVDPWVGFRQMARLAAHARPKAYLGTPKSHLLRLVQKELRRLDIAPLFIHSLERGEARAGVHPVRSADRALITFTTGSSGKPKGANRTHAILRAQHEQLAAEFPAAAGDVDLCTFPIFALNNLACGVPTLIPPADLRRVAKADPRAVAAAMRRCAVTTASASPPLFDRLAGLAARDPAALPRLRRLLTGGAPVTDAQLRSWQAAFPGAEIVVAYGSSEAEPVAHVGAAERLEARSSLRPLAPGYLAGKPVQGVRAKLIPLRPGTEEAMGELVVAGDHVCRDYDGDPEAAAENKIADPDGTVWHRMGDTGYFDRQGRFWIAGRIHSTIERRGQLVHPQLVEQAARGDDPRVRRVAAVGIDDRLIVVVESNDALEADVRERLAAAELPCDEVRITRRPLPVDPRHNSKIDYVKVRQWLRS